MRQVKPSNNNGAIQLKWTFQGKRYALSGFGRISDKTALIIAEQVGSRIYLDCLTGSFDPTLDRYRIEKRPDSTHRSDHLEIRLNHRIQNQYNPADVALMGNLIQWGDPIASQEQAQAFVEWLRDTKKLAPSTIKRYLNSCRAIAPEWFQGIKAPREIKPEIRPFSKEEVNLILTWIQEHRSYAYGFLLFLFHTGCRTSEAIGIRWSDLSLSARTVTVNESLGRNRGSAAQRVRKSTKNGKGRTIPLSNTLHQWLSQQERPRDPSDLVFQSYEGKTVNDVVFLHRVWQPCLKSIGIPYRPQYNSRHTFASHCFEAGLSPAQVAYLLGDNLDTVVKRYVGLIDKPVIPQLY